MSNPDETMEGDGGPVVVQLGSQDPLTELLNDQNHSVGNADCEIKVTQIEDGLPVIDDDQIRVEPVEPSNDQAKMSEPAPESTHPATSSTQDSNVSIDMPSLNVKSDLLLKEMNELICGPEPEKKESAVVHLDDEQTDKIDIEEPYNLNPQVNMEDMKAAQEELRGFDVLVCGSCHMVFHFVEEFGKHKGVCRKRSNFHGNIAENKPQVWAFLLWKNAQAKINRRGFPIEESSWKLYQKWCKMPERIRNAWVAAGETVMTFSTFGSPKQLDNINKPAMKRDVREGYESMDTEENKPVIMRKLVHRDHLGEIKEIRPTNADSSQRRFSVNENIENIRNHIEDGDNSMNKEVEVLPPTGEDTLREEEFVVEKIVSRRFNPRRKQYEYLLKWEGYPSEQNTWEPAENLEACQHLLKAFEENLAKQSMSKPKTGGGGNSKRPEHNQAGPSGLNSFGRPVRYSKQKALNQVKAWCGSIKPDDSEIESLKRTLTGSDSEDDEDPYAKRVKLERDSDSEDSIQGRVMYGKGTGIVRRGGRGGKMTHKSRQMANGTTENLAAALGLESSGDEADPSKMKLSPLDFINQKGVVKKVSSLSLANQQVLVANAKGVVKVHPSQVPNLSSGVYIMSNKSGIFKLDSVTPSAAMSIKQGVTQKTQQSPLPPPPKTPQNNNASGSSGVIMLKSQGQGGQKSGIMRKTPALLRNSNNLSNTGLRGPGRPQNIRPSGVLRAPNPSSRLFHSGAASARSNVTINPVNRVKTPLKAGDNVRKPEDSGKRILGPKPARGRGAFNRGRGGVFARGTGSVSDTDSIGSKGKDKLQDSDNVMADFNPDSLSSESDNGIPDDGFPVGELPPLGPASPPRPLTLCPETGKVLSKAEGEKTPEPTPPPSPKPPPTVEEKPKSSLKSDKTEEDSTQAPSGSFLTKPNNKEALVKKTFKPGTIGSVTVSPKKEIIEDTEEAENPDEIVTITGEDGLIYKVSKSDLGNTVLMAEGAEGQQCVYVTTGEDGDENATVLTLDASAFSESQLGRVNILSAEGEEGTQFYVKDSEEGELVGLQVQTGDDSEEPQAQVVAQLVEAGEPAPGGGPRRVVLLLPDGNIMMTEVDEEQYAALELDK